MTEGRQTEDSEMRQQLVSDNIKWRELYLVTEVS